MPNERFMVKGDLYNRIFADQTPDPGVIVDYEVWNRILAGLRLANGYKLPDWHVLSTMVDNQQKP
ncbi:hypothetical protein [Paenibacillus lignilyticus]|uniref:Uncharacterized protein n=1 Tax=Paenibacillus lignilyticus TaxID=1172615 RepID=A0ABS5CLY3_9BACL|nr:hypothetical protein [Paenibacillus lignilyticus]MBP3966817.1 hypothetical protein [Paenibacillus lignilyticus]